MIVSATGWTWQHVEAVVTLPQALILSRFWQAVPPAAVQLKRIALALGLPDPKPVQTSARTADEAMQEAVAAGLPVMDGRPDDPMLEFLGL